MNQKIINVPILARVEGEGALELVVENNMIKKLQLRIYEPPRLFEKFLEGRYYYDVADMVARICGICPIAYQMSAIHAIESIFNLNPGKWVREMRRLFYCGEWIESHGLHVHFLAAPDFLGFDNAISMAAKYPQVVERGIRLRKLGNDLVSMFGGRSVNPVGACVGGFCNAPTVAAVSGILPRLYSAEVEAADLVRWVASLDLPNFSHDVTFVSLHHPEEYPFNEGRLVSNKGLDIGINEYTKFFTEQQSDHSTALYGWLGHKPYLVGPLARLNNNFQLLPTKVLNLIEEIGLQLPSKNVFHSIIARALEIYYAVLEAIRILENYTPELPRLTGFVPTSGRGFGCTEAPRGILWHYYESNEKGIITTARIVPPTSQNQAQIENDLKLSLGEYGLDKTDSELRLMAEKVIRNYDPCISCSVHYLNNVVIERKP